jgi:hypothetical protein
MTGDTNEVRFDGVRDIAIGYSPAVVAAGRFCRRVADPFMIARLTGASMHP